MRYTKKQLRKVLNLIARGSIKTITAAEELGISTRHLNRIMLKENVYRPSGARKLQDQQALENKQARREAAGWVMTGKYTLAKAATLAKCSTRTLRRYMAAGDYE